MSVFLQHDFALKPFFITVYANRLIFLTLFIKDNIITTFSDRYEAQSLIFILKLYIKRLKRVFLCITLVALWEMLVLPYVKEIYCVKTVNTYIYLIGDLLYDNVKK